MARNKFFDFMTCNGNLKRKPELAAEQGRKQIFFIIKEQSLSEITIKYLSLRPKQKGALNEKQRTEMGANVKNTNNLTRKFGRMKYFATLSLRTANF